MAPGQFEMRTTFRLAVRGRKAKRNLAEPAVPCLMMCTTRLNPSARV